VRCCKLALNHGLGGPITGASAYLMKSPPEQHPDPVARQMVEDFIEEYGGAPKLPGQKPAQAPADATASETTIDT
jgi:myo-inositol-1-phosphate synthase